MVILAVRVVVKAGTEPEVVEWFRQLTVQSRSEPGCLLYIVNQSIANPRMFLVYEQYENDEALAAHRNSPHFQEFATQGVYTRTESRDADLFHIVC